MKMKKKKSIPLNIENLASEEEFEDSGFCDAPTGTTVAQFSFENDSEAVQLNEPHASEDTAKTFKSAAHILNVNSSQPLIDTRTLKSEPNGITPPVDGEFFDIKRSFSLRKSTIRHLNELKAAHPDINVYLNTIVDKALNHYHDYIFNKNGSQD